MLPALANKVTPDQVQIPIELSNLFSINWLYGFVSSCIIYYALNFIFPDRKSLIPCVIYGDTEITEGGSSDANSGLGDEEKLGKAVHYSPPVEVSDFDIEKKM